MVIFVRNFILSLSLFVTQSAFSCAVCGFGEDGSRQGYLITTALMTFMPMFTLGIVGYFFWNKIKKNQIHDQIIESQKRDEELLIDSKSSIKNSIDSTKEAEKI